MVSSLLLGAALISAPLRAAEKVVVNISKVDGMPWFNRMGEGVVEAGKAFGVNASQVGPSSTDAPQQVKIIEDLIARKVNAITIVPNDANVLEPVFKKSARCRNCGSDQRIPPVSQVLTGILKSLITKNLPLNMLSIWRNAWGARAAM